MSLDWNLILTLMQTHQLSLQTKHWGCWARCFLNLRKNLLIKALLDRSLWGDEGNWAATDYIESDNEDGAPEFIIESEDKEYVKFFFDASSAIFDPVEVNTIRGFSAAREMVVGSFGSGFALSRFHGITEKDKYDIDLIPPLYPAHNLSLTWIKSNGVASNSEFSPYMNIGVDISEIKKITRQLLRNSLHEIYEVGMDNSFKCHVKECQCIHSGVPQI